MSAKITGIIIMGGQAKRLGSIDKSASMIAGRSCFERVRSALAGGTDGLALSLAGASPIPPLSRLGAELEIIRDWPSETQRGGPAFAVLAGLEWARSTGQDAIITSTVDTPFLPPSYGKALRAMFEGNPLSGAPIVCKSAGRVHGLHALWPAACLDAYKALVLERAVLKMSAIHEELGSRRMTFDPAPYDPFFNINTPEELEAATAIANTYAL